MYYESPLMLDAIQSRPAYFNTDPAFENALLASQNMPRGSHASSSSNSVPSSTVNAWSNYASTEATLPSYRERYQAEAMTNIENLSDRQHVLDLGSNAGYLPLEMAKAANSKGMRLDITAVDIIPSTHFERAKADYNDAVQGMVRYKQSHLPDLKMSKDKYSFINATASLPYLRPQDQFTVIQKMARAIRPGGGSAQFDVYLGPPESSRGQAQYALTQKQYNDMLGAFYNMSLHYEITDYGDLKQIKITKP